jgi:hypothetical protein
MEEILPGIHHWTALHPRIKQRVSSYYVEPAGILIDPMAPKDGLRFFEELDLPPQQVVLTNRHHYRESDRFREAFGCVVRASEPGLHEFEGTGREVEGFSFGEEVAPGVTAVEIGAICPDETALHIAVGDGAVAFADGLVRPRGGPLGFVPDYLMDDPPATRQGLLDSFRGLLERDFDALLFAHGDPLTSGGRSALSDFVNSG